MKKFLKTLALALTSIIIGLILSEFLVRIAAPQRLDSPRPLWEADEYVVFKLRKNLMQLYSQTEFEVLEATNTIGLRDREIGPKRAGLSRILGLGDSNSFANGVNLEETYFKQLEQCLTVSSGRPTEVINCAVPAYSLLQEIGFLKKYGMALEPDAVLIGFSIANDFTDSYELLDAEGKPRVRVNDDGFLVSQKPSDIKFYGSGVRGLLLPIRTYLATHLHLYVFLRNRLSELLVRLRLRSTVPPPEFCAKEFSDNVQKGWELDQRLLIDLRDFVRQHKMRLIVLIIPEIYQVHESAWNRYVKTFDIDPNLYDLDKPQRLLMEFCTQHQIECVDVLPLMRMVGKEKQLCYPLDNHMNPEGHRVVADILCRYLSANPNALADRAGR